ncbi:hypothetical protein [Roseobacter sp. S98]|uniref:hypothetical protein n=1 Tax=Roseobacter algicola (ex Choi et al. 2025) (nom. illeg.) TaxID=3092138 RepID=UPI0035C722AD
MSDVSDHLVRSAKFFSAEAVRNSIEASNGSTERWQLGVLHIVTALEHSAKAALAKVHPSLIRQNLENPNTTVGIESAFERLADREIRGIAFSTNDKKRLRTAVRLRNDVAHGSTRLNDMALAAKFYEVYAFQREFLKFHLQVDVREFLSTAEYEEISRNQQSSDALMSRAQGAVREDDEIFLCVDCFEELSAFRENRFICLFCHHEEPAAFCDRCEKPMPEQLQNSTSELYEYEWTEGRANFIQDYGVKEKSVCDACFKQIEQEVDAEKEAQLFEDFEDEYYYSRAPLF